MEKLELLKSYWGYSGFRGKQETVIDNILSGNDVLCVMPTGAGKSICYQLPSLMLSGVSIVISPLISLMVDQVRALVNMGIKAAYINSTLSAKQQSLAIQRARSNTYKIIYVAPEKLLTSSFIDLCKNIDISMVAVDEAHCISQWGQDFRPEYQKIVEFIDKLSKRPIVSAFTATATIEVKEDIERCLQLKNPYTITTGFDRPNLSFEVMQSKNKDTQLLTIVKENINDCGIVYCNTRSNVESVCSILQENGINALAYHAGMPMEERKKNQEAFIYDRCKVIVATNAFGMGIDKPDVSYVVHYNMPQNIESYYQEAGRAGRDGNNARCVILYSGKDYATNKFLIEKSRENEELKPELAEIIIENKIRQLNIMVGYCNTADCLRGYILKYFGQPHSDYCGNCSNCKGEFEEVDITTDAQKALSCVAKTRQRFGIKMIADILRGSKNQNILNYGLEKQSTYGIMKNYTEAEIKQIINYLIVKDYAQRTQDKFPVVKLNSNSTKILKGEQQVIMRVKKGTAPAQKTKEISAVAKSGDYNNDMYEYLRSIRTQLADEESVPAYIIFSNASLQDMCVKKPVTLSEFLNVNGVGKQKVERYGLIFTTAIGLYLEYENGFYTKEEIELTPKQLRSIVTSYTKGCRVKHKHFGSGTVTEVKAGNIIKVQFDSGEEKMLATNYFGMRIIEKEEV